MSGPGASPPWTPARPRPRPRPRSPSSPRASAYQPPRPFGSAAPPPPPRPAPPLPPPLRTNRTRRVPHPVLIGHAAPPSAPPLTVPRSLRSAIREAVSRRAPGAGVWAAHPEPAGQAADKGQAAGNGGSPAPSTGTPPHSPGAESGASHPARAFSSGSEGGGVRPWRKGGWGGYGVRRGSFGRSFRCGWGAGLRARPRWWQVPPRARGAWMLAGCETRERYV